MPEGFVSHILHEEEKDSYPPPLRIIVPKLAIISLKYAPKRPLHQPLRFSAVICNKFLKFL